MPALVDFADLVKITGPTIFTGPDEFLNEAVNQTFSLPWFTKGKGKEKLFRGGISIDDQVMFDDGSTFQTYLPNDSFTFSQPQVATNISIRWRHAMDYKSWTDHEVLANAHPGMTRSATFHQYKSLLKKLDQRVATSTVNGLEALMWADAGSQQNNMEATGGQEPYSIPALITEDDTNYHASGWTTIATIDPANESGWRNAVETYDYDDPDDSDGDGDGLIDAFDNMIGKLYFKNPGLMDAKVDARVTQTSNLVIFCSLGGLNLYKRMLRASNDTLVRKQDASYPMPEFNGVPLERIAQLDTAQIFWDPSAGGAAATETSGTPDGYRYFWLNTDAICPVFHQDRYFFQIDPYRLPQQPFTHVAPIDIMFNLFPHSRRRCGIVAPA